MTPSFDG